MHDVALMRRAGGPEMGVKASGGIRTLDDLKKWSPRERRASGPAPALRLSRPPRVRPHTHDSPTPKAQIRFRERAELLDFLLEVSRITAETLDLDKLLENVASIVKEVVPYDLFAILL